MYKRIVKMCLYLKTFTFIFVHGHFPNVIWWSTPTRNFSKCELTVMAEFSICIYVKGEDGRDNLVGNSSASHAGDLGLNPKLGLDSGHTNA